MNPLDIFKFLKPDFSDLLQATFFFVMLGMLMFTIFFVHISTSPRSWEKKWNRASHSKTGTSQGLEQGGITDLFHIVATRSEKLAEIMPGMLLIVGLLGTFIGLGLALDKASFILGANNAMDAAGAADGLQNMLGMLKGLGTKFKTSTWGITGFILMKIWSEITQFEENRLAWVIGKVKKEADERNSRTTAAEEEKWKKFVQLGSAMTSKLATTFENGIEKSLQAANFNNRELLEKSAFLFTAQTTALNDQQNQIQQKNANTFQEIISNQQGIYSLFHKQAHTLLQNSNEQNDRTRELLNTVVKQQINIAQTNTSTLNGLFTTHIGSLSEKIHNMADASQKTNAAMQDFTNNTQKVVSNMDSAAQRMASGADNVGTAAKDLLGAVGKFEQQFTEVLNNVRTDLGKAISEMSTQASQTLEMGSTKLSDATIQISQSLEQLSADVTGTMKEVQDSIKEALNIQKQASVQFINSSTELREGIHEITAKFENLTSPIEDGLAAISKSNVQLKTAVSGITDGLKSGQEINTNISSLNENISQTNEIFKSTATPLQKIQSQLISIENHISSRPTAEKGITHAINNHLNSSLTPLNKIHELLQDLHTDSTMKSIQKQKIAGSTKNPPLLPEGHKS